MKKLALGALFAGIAACGGGGNNNNVVIVDVPTEVGPTGCNPLTQLGCAPGEKCANRTLQTTPTEINEIACVPNGTGTQDQACTEGPPGAMGYSNCAAGFECVNAVCKQICDPQGGTPMCDAQHSCSRYDGLFESGDMTVAGVCDPKCDPLTQELLAGANTTACGSANPAMATAGCFTFDIIDFTCAGIPMQARGLTDRMTAFGPASGGAYVNGCAAGYLPFFRLETGSTTVVCAGICAPKKTDSSATGAVNPAGDPTKAAKLHTSAAPAVGDGVCTVGKKGSSQGGENCHYLWMYSNDGTNFIDTPYGDNTGVCFSYTHYSYDATADGGSATQGYPACQTIAAKGAPATPIYGNADEWPCYSKVDAAFAPGTKKLNPAMKDFRVGSVAGQGLRHLIRQ